MSNIAIEVEGLSKAYQLGQFNTGALAHDLKRWWALSRGKEDPFLKIGEANDRTKFGKSNIVWSLKDIDLKIEQGDAVGIIGRNGAGKSTLLKILSRITSPTAGEIRINGRVASLLEVGTGFHPELTGRENIYLNGAILGMRSQEIKRKFDEIVDFSGVERYIDTPVKRYSSGMYVRLAFAVAAHLESEILIVDEVLAVGDAEFQKKCLGKMGAVSKGEGRTVLFVSHNLASISALCKSILYLKNGSNSYFGNLQEGIDLYSNQTTSTLSKRNIMDLINVDRFGNGRVKFRSLKISTTDEQFLVHTGDNLLIELSLVAYDTVKNFTVTAVIYDRQGIKILEVNNKIKGITIDVIKGQIFTVKFTISSLLLASAEYLLGLWAGIPGEDMDAIEHVTIIDILKNDSLISADYKFQGIYQAQFDFTKF